jgi:Tfp pilus assembly protein PilF
MIQIGALEAALGDGAAAQRTLERALELKPADPQALAELARLREGGSDWDGYATAREQEAEVAATPAAAVRALLDAARVHRDKRDAPADARRCLERALEMDPAQPEALAALGQLQRKAGELDAADDLARRELGVAATDERKAELHAALGESLLARGELEEAAASFRASLGRVAGFAPAVRGLAEVAAQSGAWDEVEALLRDAVVRDGVPASVGAELYRRLAVAADHRGRADDAYAALLEADRLAPGELRTRIALGENRYKQNRFREAAQHLGPLADVQEVPATANAAEAAYHGALAELKLRRPERALPLLDAAVRFDPEHVAALGLLAERALEAGDLARAIELLERQARSTPDGPERGLRFERVADVLLGELKDPLRACAAYQLAAQAAGPNASDELLDKTLRLERETGQLERASATAVALLEREAPAPVRARRLREAAALDAALGSADAARARLREVLELAPLDQEALAGLSAMLVTEGKDEEAAQLLTRALPLLPVADPSLRAARASLWMRLGEARERLRDGKGATLAFEKALEADPSRRPLREVLLGRYGDDPANDEAVRAHRMVLLADDPLHVPSLRALAQLEARIGAHDGGRRFRELLAAAGALTDDERRALGGETVGPTADALPASLDGDDEHVALAHPDARPLAQVFAALWEGTAAERAPDLAAFDVGNDDRVSPVDDSALARAYSLCARALGNRKTGLYRKGDPAFVGVALCAHPPTAIIVGPGIADGRADADLRFILGRALEIARPEYVLATALARDDFTRLFAAILRAFHPRHARRRLETGAAGRDDEAAMWKRALPYKVARRLAELFADLADTEFSSVRWRRAVQHTGNRAGLVCAGDVIAAARVLTAEGDSDGLRELARFAASDAYLALRKKLEGAPPARR